MDFTRAFLGAVALLAVAAAPDTFTRDELRELEAEKAEAETRLKALESAGELTGVDLERIDAQMISAAMESRRREEMATASERKLIDLRARQNSAQAELLQDRESLEELLAALASANRRRPPALIVSPDKANTAVRAAIVMGDAAPRLSDRAGELAEEIETLNTLERDIRRERARLEAAEATLAANELEIKRLAAAKRAQYEDLSAEAAVLKQTVTSLGERAETLRDLLTTLEAAAPATPGSKPSLRPRYASLSPRGGTMTDISPRSAPAPNLKPLGARALGGLGSPAAGLIARSFGDRTPAGDAAEGLTVVTRQRAQVTAPVDGRIEYAGTFRSYGQMLILSTSDGYHVILSGLGALYGSVGQTVATGEPVGQMPDRASPPPELYMELRRDGRPMNPAEWMKRGR